MTFTYTGRIGGGAFDHRVAREERIDELISRIDAVSSVSPAQRSTDRVLPEIASSLSAISCCNESSSEFSGLRYAVWLQLPLQQVNKYALIAQCIALA
jgi:hypothetical protein